MAKSAELNGIPGPAHLLELKKEINLSELQIEKIETIWSEMNRSAKRYGQNYLSIEEKIENFFRHQQQDTAVLQGLLSESSFYLAKLRETQLNAHLKVRPLLSEQQVMQYNHLRGYASKSEHNQHKSH